MTRRKVGQGWSAELFNLYHLARTALADRPQDRQTSYDRMVWAAAAFAKEHRAISGSRAYKELSRMRDNGGYQTDWLAVLLADRINQRYIKAVTSGH